MKGIVRRERSAAKVKTEKKKKQRSRLFSFYFRFDFPRFLPCPLIILQGPPTRACDLTGRCSAGIGDRRLARGSSSFLARHRVTRVTTYQSSVQILCTFRLIHSLVSQSWGSRSAVLLAEAYSNSQAPTSTPLTPKASSLMQVEFSLHCDEEGKRRIRIPLLLVELRCQSLRTGRTGFELRHHQNLDESGLMRQQ